MRIAFRNADDPIELRTNGTTWKADDGRLGELVSIIYDPGLSRLLLHSIPAHAPVQAA